MMQYAVSQSGREGGGDSVTPPPLKFPLPSLVRLSSIKRVIRSNGVNYLEDGVDEAFNLQCRHILVTVGMHLSFIIVICYTIVLRKGNLRRLILQAHEEICLARRFCSTGCIRLQCIAS